MAYSPLTALGSFAQLTSAWLAQLLANTEAIRDGSGLATTAISLGYSSTSTAQGGITTETDLTSLASTVSVPDGGRRVEIRVDLHMYSTVSADVYKIRIKEGSTTLRTFEGVFETGNFASNHMFTHTLVPSSGSHTYKVSLERAAGTGTFSTYAPSSTYINSIHVKAV